MSKWFVGFLCAGFLILGSLLAKAQGSATSDFPIASVMQPTAHIAPATSTHVMGELNPSFTLKRLMRGLLGVVTVIVIAFALSNNKSRIPWRIVFFGVILQALLALGILYIPWIQQIFSIMGKAIVLILDFSKEGSRFLFGNLVDLQASGYIFAFQVLPSIVFFAALSSLLFYLGVIQFVVRIFAWVLTKVMRISGPEGLCTAGNVFLDQNVSPLLIKNYLAKMSDSEMITVMIAGMATLSGGVLAAYIGFLGGNDPVQRLFFAKHLLAASVMAAPGALVVAKIIIPPAKTPDYSLDVNKTHVGKNLLDALANGTIEGLKIAVTVAAMLLVFIALVAGLNFLLGHISEWVGWNEAIMANSGGRFKTLSLEFLLGYALYPLMWFIGIDKPDMLLLGQLLGKKLILNEFIGYIDLASLKQAGAFFSDRSIVLATYILCGFANISSVGMLIGSLGAMEPSKKQLVTRLGLRALIGGALASLLSAAVIGSFF